MASILSGCGRIIADISVSSTGSANSLSCSLLLDSGAEKSVLPYNKISAALGGATLGPPVRCSVAGSTFTFWELWDVILELEIQPHGGGQIARLQRNVKVLVHFFNLPNG